MLCNRGKASEIKTRQKMALQGYFICLKHHLLSAIGRTCTVFCRGCSLMQGRVVANRLLACLAELFNDYQGFQPQNMMVQYVSRGSQRRPVKK